MAVGAVVVVVVVGCFSEGAHDERLWDGSGRVSMRMRINDHSSGCTRSRPRAHPSGASLRFSAPPPFPGAAPPPPGDCLPPNRPGPAPAPGRTPPHDRLLPRGPVARGNGGRHRRPPGRPGGAALSEKPTQTQKPAKPTQSSSQPPPPPPRLQRYPRPVYFFCAGATLNVKAPLPRIPPSTPPLSSGFHADSSSAPTLSVAQDPGAGPSSPPRGRWGPSDPRPMHRRMAPTELWPHGRGPSAC